MKRIFAGFALALLIFPAAVAAGAVTVKNPMVSDLDGGGYSLLDLNRITLDGDLTVTKGIIYLDGNHNRPALLYGTQDPRTDPRAAGLNPGTLFLRYSNPAEVWLQVGADQSTFRQLAFAP